MRGAAARWDVGLGAQAEAARSVSTPAAHTRGKSLNKAFHMVGPLPVHPGSYESLHKTPAQFGSADIAAPFVEGPVVTADN